MGSRFRVIGRIRAMRTTCGRRVRRRHGLEKRDLPLFQSYVRP